MTLFHNLRVVRLLLSNNRFKSHVRREYPLLCPLVLLLVGQALGWSVMVGVGWEWGSVGFVILLSKWLRRRLLWVTLGCLSVFAALIPSSLAQESTGRYLGVVVSMPRHARTGGVSVDFELSPMVGMDVSRSSPLRARCSAPHLPWRQASALRYGEVAIVTADLKPVKRSVNPFSWYRSMSAERIDAQCRVRWVTRSIGHVPHGGPQFADKVRRNVEQIVGASEGSGLLLSMAFGFRDTISEDTERDFRATGLTHLLVLSGFQVTLLFASLNAIARMGVRYFLRRGADWVLPIVPIGALGAVFVFLVYLGIEDAGSRAVLSASLALFSVWNERGTTFLNSVIASGFLCSVIWPCVLFNIGMQLTFAALLGIATGSAIDSATPIRKFLSVTYATWLCTSLICLAWFKSFSLLGLFANAFIAPLASLVGTQGGLLSWFLFVIGIDTNGYLLAHVVDALFLLKEVVHTLSEWSGGVLILEGAARWAAFAYLCLSVMSLMMSRVAVWGKSRGFVRCFPDA